MKGLSASIAVLFALLALVGCQSGPAQKETMPEAEYKQATSLKKKIETFNLSQYAPEEYEKGKTKYAEGEALYNKNDTASRKPLEDALANFKIVMKKGFPYYVSRIQGDADGMKKKAEDIKAYVSEKAKYEEAQKLYEEAKAADAAGDSETAADKYEAAKKAYEEAYTTANTKKNTSEQSLKETRENLGKFEELAQ